MVLVSGAGGRFGTAGKALAAAVCPSSTNAWISCCTKSVVGLGWVSGIGKAVG